jgi:hypothetical protein
MQNKRNERCTQFKAKKMQMWELSYLWARKENTLRKLQDRGNEIFGKTQNV